MPARGPRSTPTLAGDRVYAFGATGVLNALDALAAYDANSGASRWSGRDGGDSYSSPHLVTIDGVRQILMMTASGITGVAVADGARLWEHAWPVSTRIVQPALTSTGDLLVGADGMRGTRRITVERTAAGWTTVERWTTSRLKPNFSDFAIHEGHAYGFDGSILTCVDVEDGERAWKGGRYGHGQLLLLRDQDLLLVLSERGELALVSATPAGFTELARVPAVEGKTWNHPVVVGDTLLVRNSREMVAFRLPPAGA